ncbi:ribonuclease P [Haloferax mediterranei ATCC 33500]|uniref:Ribonuclease P protein component 2 n=1 Tax=Haloferax mediterranei (strain ATCC 33500 / DSM 1411 / JCM 8866 / NBRC 14739 / NCIMB 2177 / R-4) TaxID=523841 RepID=I3R3K6_HALMT|nr:Rpp14/Pop5 family protein [Haloferax mediterranei]AFK18816.1 RNaseP subunit 14 [Haloferax mediterranei ATCC 33500]AHZ21817.1 ribonuclease P [Haloferax mediterranei ATCC 33500]EMA03326.1 RNaseP subunit 14 [Haloferax mediterranei ATCC 33500]MDX5988909.1 Rpp14/Pop5 family protein [Haloferax mediterranei ATCC 33500]QCQ75307.1 ribonuclease P [Haloferax mediterranei ATCC 33500]
MKHLPKHLRPRWRYLAVEIETWPDASLNRGAFQRELWYAAQNLFGDSGSADADLTVLGFDSADGIAETIVRARRGYVDETRAALACIDEVGSDPVGVRVRGVSGTVRACSERYLHGRAGISQERDVVFENESRTAVVRNSLLDVRGPDGFTGATQLDFE